MGTFSATITQIFGMDIRAMALLRIGLSWIIVLNCIYHLPLVKEFYSDQGVFPRTASLDFMPFWTPCLNLISGDPEFQMFLMLFWMFIALLLTIGFKTRLCTIIMWILLCSFHSRNILILGAEDKFLRVLFFWFMFIPWGHCYSVDSWLRRRHAPLRVCTLGTAGCLVQIFCFYFFAGVMKYAAPWYNGTAAYIILAAKQFTKPVAAHLLQYPDLLKFLTFSALTLERVGPLLWLSPFKTTACRMISIVLFSLFHIGLMLCMELQFFQWMCLVILIAFIPTPILNKFLRVPPCVAIQPEPSRRPKWWPNLFHMPIYMKSFTGFMLVYIVCWNLYDLDNKRFPLIPKNLRWVAYTFHVRQHWGMYGPTPFQNDGWFVIPGVLGNGQSVDVFKGGGPVSWKEPESFIKHNKHYSWMLYYLNVHDPRFHKYARHWGRYLCREWNAKHSGPDQLERLEIVFMLRHVMPDMVRPAFKMPMSKVVCK